MSARRNVALLLLIVAGPFTALALGILFLRGRPPMPPEPIPAAAFAGANVLLITVDALRSDHLGVYASTGSLTPAIDRFAREGLYFERTYSHVPVAEPSYRTLMTAAYPNRRDAAATLAGQLRNAGYRTGAFVGSGDLAAPAGLAAGFDRYDDRLPDGAARGAEQVFGAAFEWLSGSGPEARGPSPWFAWIHLSDPNDPYRPPEPFASRFSAEGYDGELSYVDAAFLAFVTGLRRSGLVDHTVLAITSGYGESLGEHGEKTHGLLAYDATLRVPLILWGPPLIKPGFVQDPMRLVDVAPTILDLLGAPPLDGADGRSIRPFIGGKVPFDGRESYFEVNGIRGVVKGTDKLMIVGPTPEFYDLRADPAELKDVYEPQNPRVKELSAILDGIR